MALPDQIDTERKRAEAGMHKSDIDQEIQDLGTGIHRITREISEEFKKVQDARSDHSDPVP